MADFIQTCSDFFDAIVNVISNIFQQFNALVVALSNIYTGLVESIGFFPSFLGGILLTCAALLLLLRLIGR